MKARVGFGLNIHDRFLVVCAKLMQNDLLCGAMWVRTVIIRRSKPNDISESRSPEFSASTSTAAITWAVLCFFLKESGPG
jgi:hypothetical protein